MKKIALLLAVFILFGCSQKKQNDKDDSEPQELITLYVNSPEGLSVRNLPKKDSEKIGMLHDGEAVKVIKETEKSVTVDGIDGKWLLVKTNTIQGWAFGGYLVKKETPNEILIGAWQSESNKDSNMAWRFQGNQWYSFGYMGTDMGQFGKWSLNNNILTLLELIEPEDWDDEWLNGDSSEYTIEIIDTDHIRTISNSGDIKTYTRIIFK